MNESQKQIIEHYVQSYNDFDVEGMTRNLDEGIVFENISADQVTLSTEGIEEFKQQAESATQYFTDRKQTIESWEFNDSTVTIFIYYVATLAVDLPTGLKAGETIRMKGSSEFEFLNGKIGRISDRS